MQLNAIMCYIVAHRYSKLLVLFVGSITGALEKSELFLPGSGVAKRLYLKW